MKKRGSNKLGGDKKTRDKMKRNNPRKNKRGGRISLKTRRGINTKVACFICKEVKKPCKCVFKNK